MNHQTKHRFYVWTFTAGFVLSIWLNSVSADSIKVVVPNRLDGVEGETSADVSDSGSFRQQQLYPATEFASRPVTHRALEGMYARPDGSVTQPGSASYADLVINVSITPVSGLDSVFADNYGDDVTTVHDGPLTISTQATGPTQGPRGFDYFFPFETPFTYDPDDGNLLVELISNSGSAGNLVVDTFESTSSLYVSSLPISSTGNVQNGGFVNQFGFVPVVGDMNGDGAVDFGDLSPFALALTDIPAYESTYPDVDRIAAGDVNMDTNFNFGDLTPFAELLIGDDLTGSTVPEPSTGITAALAAVLCSAFQRRRD